MALTTQNCGAVILAGGQSRRMGRCKALLPLDGETLLARMARQLSAFDELLLSANDFSLAEGLPVRTVPDQYSGDGPLAGLHAALSATKKDYLLCVSCDLPLFTADAANCLLREFPEGADAMACVDSTGRVHPLCGIYAKSALPVFQRQLEQGRFRMKELLELLDCRSFFTTGYFPDRVLLNVNTPEAYLHLLQEEAAHERL